MITPAEAKKLWDLIKPIKVSMLVSSNNNQMQARPMHLVQNDFSGILYFFTEINSEKAKEIQEDNDICLTFSCANSQTYVSINGKGSVSHDQILIDQFWNPFVSAWFPQGKKDPSVGLIKIDVYQAEYWQGKDIKLVQLFKYAKALIINERPKMGEHENLG